MTQATKDRETQRGARQAELDGQRTQAERNRLGQFATPVQLARDVLTYGLSLLPPAEPVRFLDPAIGTGSFYSALEEMRGDRPIGWARGFEIDPHYGAPAQSIWHGTALEIALADFTQQIPPSNSDHKANLLICNPPYVRHHHLDGAEKTRLRKLARDGAHIRLSGLAGFYCYFIALAHSWMKEEGVAGWLVPSEFMDVNYGRELKQYLLTEVTLLHIHRFDPNDVQFDDALVSSAVVWFKRVKPTRDHEVEFSYGGTLQRPATVRRIAARDLLHVEKWTKFPQQALAPKHEGYCLGDLFAIKRGLATGDNTFFIVDEQKVERLNLPKCFLRPVLPSSRYIKGDEILADDDGIPLLDKRLFLIDCDRAQEDIEREYPSLWDYLQTGIERVAVRYLCRSRRYWYSQEKRPAAPIICTYLGRSDHDGRPFRFLLNRSRATATNVYLMLYPKPLLATRLSDSHQAMRLIWEALNQIKAETLLHNGRVYGGGLHKLEPRELANVPADNLATIVGLGPKRTGVQLELATEVCSPP